MTTSHDDVEQAADGSGPIDVVHDQTIDLVETRLDVQYGVTGALAVGLTLPFRVFSTTITYLGEDGREVAILGDDIHHRDETLTGVGDPWLYARWSRAFGPNFVDVRLGVTLPLGHTEPDPFVLGDMGIRHEHFQFGTGTVNAIAAVALQHRFVRGYALTQQTFYENDEGYHAGDRYIGGVGVTFPVGKWRFNAGGEVMGETAERWNGEVPTDDGNQGRVDVLALAGAQVAFAERWRASLDLRVPLYVEIVNGHIDYPAVISLGLAFDLDTREPPPDEHEGEDEHGHDHEHGDEHGDEHGEHGDEHAADAPEVDWAGTDMVHVADAGQAVDLTPVPGKITVFDFWAPWCKPCKALDVELVMLARRHPDLVAIRKVNIVDWDSPAAARYLKPGTFDLPHLKVFGTDGTLLFERSAGPAVLARDVESAIDAASGRAP